MPILSGTYGTQAMQYGLSMPNAESPETHSENADRERDLVARFRAGDRDAFAVIYQTHSPVVFRFVLHMSGDAVQAGEITQDVFVWLIRHPHRFDPARGRLSSFLMGVARHLLMRRRQSDRKSVPLDGAAVTAGLQSAAPVDWRVGRLRELIATLPARYREVVVLCDLEERTYEEAASILECAVGTIRSRLHRARELLVRKLDAEKETLGCTA